MDHFIGEEASSNINIIANDALISEDGSAWKPVWLHDTPLGHDKARSITEARAQANDLYATMDGTVPLIVFIGDGVSDLAAAREADVLFARRGLRLEEYCIENQIPHISFDTFADIQAELTKIAKRDEEKTQGQGMPVEFNPRANMWRRLSSRTAIPALAQFTPKEERIMALPRTLSHLGQESAPIVA